MPQSIWDEAQDLSLGEFRLLGYIIRHTIGFRRDCEFLTDEELLNGRKIGNGKRVDKGCGIKSANTLKKARESLIARGMISVKSDEQGNMYSALVDPEDNGQNILSETDSNTKIGNISYQKLTPQLSMIDTPRYIRGKTMKDNKIIGDVASLPADDSKTNGATLALEARLAKKLAAEKRKAMAIMQSKFSAEFEAAYGAWPRKPNKLLSFARWEAAVSLGVDPIRLRDAATKYASENGKFAQNFLAWMDSRGWETTNAAPVVPPAAKNGAVEQFLREASSDLYAQFHKKSWFYRTYARTSGCSADSLRQKIHGDMVAAAANGAWSLQQSLDSENRCEGLAERPKTAPISQEAIIGTQATEHI